MIFTETKLAGAFLIEPERNDDVRGFFARNWSEKEFVEQGLISHFVEANISFSHKTGTLRGMHYQAAPYGQVKLVRCTLGAIYDVIIDLQLGIRRLSNNGRLWNLQRKTISRSTSRWISRTDSKRSRNSEVAYQVSSPYHPESSRGLRWNNPALEISWPEGERVIINKRSALS